MPVNINNSKITALDLYNDLLDRIVSLDLVPGQAISENKICKEYNVSRSVVRMAFARLSQINMIDVYPQKGTYVSKINLNYIKTILIMRLAIEKEMIARFMRIEDKETILQRLRENLDKQKAFADTHKYIDEFKQLDEQFHEIIIMSSESQNVLKFMNEHLIHIARWRNLSVNIGDRMLDLIEEHSRILEAIESGDTDEVLRRVEDHLQTVTNMPAAIFISAKEYIADFDEVNESDIKNHNI